MPFHGATFKSTNIERQCKSQDNKHHTVLKTNGKPQQTYRSKKDIRSVLTAVRVKCARGRKHFVFM